MKTGLEMISQERAEQTDTGMDSEDYKWGKGELAFAGIAYALCKSSLAHIPMYWPWRDDKWNPSEDHRVNLAKAGALFGAEIDRINRNEEQDNAKAMASKEQ